MDKLWAPWRSRYVGTKKTRGCIFCAAAKAKNSRSLVFKTRYSLAMLNKFPYNNGHIMLAPLRHIKDISGLKNYEILDLFQALKLAKKKLKNLLRPGGYNIGINISEIAGAGIPGHLHIHIVPRWRGDTNFMPVLYKTKVISQSLKELLKKLKNA